MVDDKKNTEELILETARQIFMEKGLAATRMQEIADRAGINKALLHYYFRSKDKLFNEVVRTIFGELIPEIDRTLNQTEHLVDGLEKALGFYFELLFRYPYLPQFIITEMYRDPENFNENMIAKLGITKVAASFSRKLIEKGYTDSDPRQIIVSFVSMVIFPFAARPLLEKVLFEGDTNAYEQFLHERQEYIAGFIHKLLEQQ